MKIGYARVSTDEQSLDVQLKKLKKSGCKKIFQEKESGTKWERPQLHKMLDRLKPGDIIVVSQLDRLARSTKMLLEITERIMKSKAKFSSLSEPWADTTSPAGKMIMTVFAGFAEFERDLIRARTSEGRKDALQRGVKFGRPSKMNSKKLNLARRLLREGNSTREVADSFGIHYTTLYRLLREQKKKKNS